MKKVLLMMFLMIVFTLPSKLNAQSTPYSLSASGGYSWYTDTYYLEQCDVHDDPWTASKGETIYKINASVKSDVIKNK